MTLKNQVLTMERWHGKVAVVTGSGSGIGEAICRKLVGHGLKVVGFEKHEDKNKALGEKIESDGGKFYPVTVDITREEDIKNGFKWAKENLGPVHILVNNAGIALNNTLIGGDYDKWKKVLDTNVLGGCLCNKEAIKSMMENNIDGHIIHINSIAGHFPINNSPTINLYAASKYAVTALTHTLRSELIAQKRKIKVTSVSPGFVQTEIMVNSGFSKEEITALYKNNPVLQPEDIADGVLYAISTPPHVQVQELTIRPLGETF